MPSLVCAMIAVVLAGPAPADVRARARDIMKQDYQGQLPSAEFERGRGGASDPSRNLRPAAPRRRGERSGDGYSGPRPFGALGSIAQMLLYALMAVALVLGALWLGRELSGYSADGAKREADPEGRGDPDAPDPNVVERPLGDADELARRGQFGEAVHVLLLRTLQELARRLPERLPASLTSREILARVRIPDDARGALAGLVGAVEISHFGGVEPGEQDFLHCRQHFQRFAAAYLRGAA